MYCDVCNEYIYYQANARLSLRKHRASSKKHKALLQLKDATKDSFEDDAEESEDEIDTSTVVDSETWIHESSSHAIFSQNVTTIPKEANYWSDDENDDMILGIVGVSSSDSRDFPTDNRELLVIRRMGKKRHIIW